MFAPAGAQVMRMASPAGPGTHWEPLMVNGEPRRPEGVLRVASPSRTWKPVLVHVRAAILP